MSDIEKENGILRGMVAKLTMKHGEKCYYCGIEDISKCVFGFPGCSLADDLLLGEACRGEDIVCRKNINIEENGVISYSGEGPMFGTPEPGEYLVLLLKRVYNV